MKRILLVLVFSFLILVPFFTVSAKPGNVKTDSNPIACPAGSVCLDNPLNVSSPQALIGKIINSILGVVGSLALLMFVYGGLTWMTSSGNQEKVKKGRDIIVWSAIGLAVIFISYALTRFVLSTVMK